MSAPQFVAIRVAPEFLLDSPTNPRVYFNDASLAELAESIKSQGVIEPIVARPIGNTLKYEIVVGHRRTRGARLAGLELIPAIVRELTDDQAATLQIHENLHRDDVSPLEEAEGFDRLIRKYKVPVTQVIKDSGKSKGYVYGRLSLRKLHKPGKDAIATGLPIELAQRVATLPTEEIQRKALADLRETEYRDGKEVEVGWYSSREGGRILDDAKYFIAIKSIKFDVDSTDLVGIDQGACTNCPRRSINDPGYESGPDVCTDVACHDVKLKAHYAQQAGALREQGHTVLEGDEAKDWRPQSFSTPVGFQSLQMGAWIDGDLVHLDEMLKRREAEAAHVPEPKLTYVMEADGSLRGYMRNADADALRKAFANAAGQDDDDDDEGEDHDTDGPNTLVAGTHATQKASEYTPEESATKANWNERIVPAIMRAAAARERTTDDLRLVALTLIDTTDKDWFIAMADLMGWGGEPKRIDQEGKWGDVDRWVVSQVPGMSADTLALFILLMSVVDVPHVGYGHELMTARVTLAKSFGVDVLAASAEPAPGAQVQTQLDGVEPAKHSEGATPPGAQPKSGKKPTARYRNEATGETWSGRGLQPKWLKAAIAAGGKLDDYAVAEASA